MLNSEFIRYRLEGSDESGQIQGHKAFFPTPTQIALIQHRRRKNDLIITPARISEPDIQQATRLIAEVETMTRRFGQKIPHLILVNDVDPLDPHYQRYMLAEIARLGLPRFETLIHKRAAYREAFMTGKPPHFAERSRAPVKKTIEEIDSLLADVKAILSPIPMKAAANAR